MAKFFNTAGLCFPEDHYMVDPLKRLHNVVELINRKLYFALHAPRQTGKTTYLYALARKLNNDGNHIALVVSFESAGYHSITEEKAKLVLIDSIFSAATLQLPKDQRPENYENKNYPTLKKYLQKWCQSQTKPIVLFIDEIDALLDDILISVLRQLRDGYQHRPKGFPISVVMVGLRDVRDYKIKIRPEQKSYGTSSPFNIKSDSLLLKNFSREEVYRLLEQHTQETGQVFPEEVKNEIFNLGNGQPWLTNALANQIIHHILADDYSRDITLETVTLAKRQLILRRDTHLDSLSDKLKEDRVKRIVQAIINGDQIDFDILDDDILYIRDLGMVSQESPLQFANPIYAEIIPRIMASPMQESIPKEVQNPRFVNKDGSLDMEKLLKEFQVFYRRNGGAWLERYHYKESAHHLLLAAFLQRVINSGGDINREMAVGNRRIDMLVTYGKQEFAIEMKIKRDKYTLEDGKDQLANYLDHLGLKEGYLVIFDPVEKEWEEKIYYKSIQHRDKKITLVGM